MAFVSPPAPTFAEDLNSLRRCAQRMDQRIEERVLGKVVTHLSNGHVLTIEERNSLCDYLCEYKSPPSDKKRPHHELLIQLLGIDPATLYHPATPDQDE